MSFNSLTAIIILSFLVSCDNSFESNAGGENVKVNAARIEVMADSAYRFIKKNNYNKNLCILIDMSLHSGVKRFFIWDFDKDTIANSFLVSHGACENWWGKDRSRSDPAFSNKDGSHCSSLGKYAILDRGYSNWGIHVKYTLEGLDPTNKNARSRIVVLHSWEKISDKEIYPDGTPEGWGCPAVSDNSMRVIDAKLRYIDGPVLMWIFK